MGVTNTFDPGDNIYGGCRYLRVLANRFGGDLRLILAAYNAGPSVVDRGRRRSRIPRDSGVRAPGALGFFVPIQPSGAV